MIFGNGPWEYKDKLKLDEDELDNLAERINILLATADWTQAEEQHWTATDLIMEWIMPYLKAKEK